MTKLGGKTPTRMDVLRQAVVGVLSPWYISFFLNLYTISNTYKYNKIDIKWRKIILSNVKPLQILVSVTKKLLPYKYEPKITWKWV